MWRPYRASHDHYWNSSGVLHDYGNEAVRYFRIVRQVSLHNIAD